jgi:hypothetical protein
MMDTTGVWLSAVYGHAQRIQGQAGINSPGQGIRLKGEILVPSKGRDLKDSSHSPSLCSGLRFTGMTFFPIATQSPSREGHFKICFRNTLRYYRRSLLLVRLFQFLVDIPYLDAEGLTELPQVF